MEKLNFPGGEPSLYPTGSGVGVGEYEHCLERLEGEEKVLARECHVHWHPRNLLRFIQAGNKYLNLMKVSGWCRQFDYKLKINSAV